jgi:nucleoside-diphosphate-sugar epimerase
MHALVTGASNQIGYFLLPSLAQHCQVTAISRRAPNISPANINWLQRDLRYSQLQDLPQIDIILHLAPIWLLLKLLTELNQTITRVIVFSSTSVHTKADSKDIQEREIARNLAQAEQEITQYCIQHNIALTILRPTLIYGCELDKNIAFMRKFIRAWGFFPIVGAGLGLRQPVHAEDLALACIQILHNPRTYGKIYNLSGGETLTYRQMVALIFKQQKQKVRIISLPSNLFKFLIWCFNWLPPFRHISPAMLDRINRDLCFNYAPAQHDFNYQPRKFSDYNPK